MKRISFLSKALLVLLLSGLSLASCGGKKEAKTDATSTEKSDEKTDNKKPEAESADIQQDQNTTLTTEELLIGDWEMVKCVNQSNGVRPKEEHRNLTIRKNGEATETLSQHTGKKYWSFGKSQTGNDLGTLFLSEVSPANEGNSMPYSVLSLSKKEMVITFMMDTETYRRR